MTAREVWWDAFKAGLKKYANWTWTYNEKPPREFDETENARKRAESAAILADAALKVFRKREQEHLFDEADGGYRDAGKKTA